MPAQFHVTEDGDMFNMGQMLIEQQAVGSVIYRIRSIKRRGYYLFHRPSLCGVYSRAATIRERRLLIPLAAREAILRETVD